jgi:hypothetical protein
MGRAIPASRDDDLVTVTIDTALVRKAARIIDGDPTFVSWVETQVAAAQAGPGRPGAFSVRSALICLWLLNVTERNSHLINIPALVAHLDPRVRRNLGIDYLDTHGNPRQLSYGQVLRVFHNIADAFDPYADGLDEPEIRARALGLQEFSSRLVRASVDNHAHAGDYAIDATLVWAWNRPPGSLKGKIERRGRDGDYGKPLSLSQIIAGDEAIDEADLTTAGFIDDPLSLIVADAGPIDPFGTEALATQRRANDPTTDADVAALRRKPPKSKAAKHGGAAWVGRGKNKAKSVFGYALHTATVTDPDAPAVIEALAVTPAPAHPARATVPLLRGLHDARLADDDIADLAELGALRALGTIVADPAYSPNVADWQLPIRAMGGSAIFRLHRNNQAGRRDIRGTTFVDGRPHCECIPNHLATLAYPKFPYSRRELDDFQDEVVRRRPFEMKPNGNYRPNGSRQFLNPHFDKAARTGGCEYCVDAFGNPVIDPTTGQPLQPCCTQATHTFSGTELGLYQDAAFGTKEWEQLWNPRNRVEGSYGVLKALALVNWGHDYHHFTGLARETLVATFAVMAYNFQIQRTHAARMKLLRGTPLRPHSQLPSAEPTETLPASIAIARHAAAAVEREASPRGPKGLEFLGSPRRTGP